jgi:hypothetical protein
MGSENVCDEVWLVRLVWLYVLLTWALPCTRLLRGWLAAPPTPPRRQRAGNPNPFPGLIAKPPCAPCEQTVPAPAVPLAPPPPLITSQRGRARQVDASTPFCPHGHCAY